VLPYEHRASIHDQTRKAVERLPAKQEVAGSSFRDKHHPTVGLMLSEDRREAGQDEMPIRYIYLRRSYRVLGV